MHPAVLVSMQTMPHAPGTGASPEGVQLELLNHPEPEHVLPYVVCLRIPHETEARNTVAIRYADAVAVQHAAVYGR
jgi:hypothetical protein